MPHFVEAAPIDVDPTIRDVADQALRDACAELHLDGVTLRWFVSIDDQGPLGKIDRLMRELSGDAPPADEPSTWPTDAKWGCVLWLTAPNTVWLNSTVPAAECRRVTRHEVRHVYQTRYLGLPRTARQWEAVEADAEKYARAVSPGLGG